MSDSALRSSGFNPHRTAEEWIKLVRTLWIPSDIIRELVEDLRIYHQLILGHHWKGQLDVAQEEISRLRRELENTKSLEEK